MGNNFLIVGKADRIKEYAELSSKYKLGLEYNDFIMPQVLDDESLCDDIISKYNEYVLSDCCTMHGAFMDVIVFSYDHKIAEISRQRMIGSMDIARRIGARAVIFHTNVNPFLMLGEYRDRAVRLTAEFVIQLLDKYSEINIYLENMFDDSPDVLCDISKLVGLRSNYGVCLDYAHASISTTDIERWITSLQPYIRHLHINDNDLKRDLHLAIGDGKIDWQQFKKYYDTYFRECTVLIETTSVEAQLKSIQYLKELSIL